jgi:integrase
MCTVSVPSSKRGPRFLSQADVTKLVSAAPDDQWRAFIVTALYTGLRSGELLELEWRDADFETRRVTVGDSWVPMHQVVFDALQAIRRRSGPVFDLGSRSAIAHRFRKVADAAGVECRPYDLRRACVGMLAAAGVPIKFVVRILRYADPRVPATVHDDDYDQAIHDAIDTLPDVTTAGKAVSA